MYGRTYFGNERTTFVIDPDGKVAQVLRKVKPAQHDELVLEALARCLSRRLRPWARSGPAGPAGRRRAAGRVIPPTSTPAPRCAPSTGPTSVQNSGSVPNSSRPSATRRSASPRRLGVLDDPVAGAALVQLVQVRDHPLERAAVRAHAPDGRDLGAEREDRLDLQRRARPSPAPRRSARPGAGTRACPGRTRCRASRALRRTACSVVLQRSPRPATACREQHQAAEAARAGLPVVHLDAARAARLGEHPRRFAGARAGAREPAGDVDRDHVATGADERLIDLEEVAHRRLRGGGQLRRVVQARVEGVEVRRTRARARARPSQPTYRLTCWIPQRSISALGQVGGAVGDHRHGRGGRSGVLAEGALIGVVAYGAGRAQRASPRAATRAPDAGVPRALSGSGAPCARR